MKNTLIRLCYHFIIHIHDPSRSFSFWVGKLHRRKGSNVQVYFSQGKTFLLRNVRRAFPHLSQNSEGWLLMWPRYQRGVCYKKGEHITPGWGYRGWQLGYTGYREALRPASPHWLHPNTAQQQVNAELFLPLPIFIYATTYRSWVIRQELRCFWTEFYVPDLQERTLFLLFSFITWTSPHSPISF